jgi:hypothetical protein
MEEQILDDSLGTIPKGKLYKDKSLWIACFFGGSLAAGYILAENFKTFGEPSNSRSTWIYSILATVLVFIAAFNIPDSVPFPNQFIPFISVLVAHLIFTNVQGKKINRHIEAGGELYSGWRALLVGVICLLITLVIIIGVIFVTDIIDLMLSSRP